MSTSTFFGLELSRRALATQQYALDITGHNIANANTKGYTRQIANMAATLPYTINSLGGKMSLGSGVNIEYISRARDSFVDRQYRWENAKQQYWEAREITMGKIENILNEPSENSLHEDLDRFWTAWNELANNPESRGARAVVRERALALIDSFKHIDQQIKDIRQDLDNSIEVQVKKINSIAEQIAALNREIKNAEVAGDNPNDLRDRRDALIDELSSIVPVRVIEEKDPNFTDRAVTIYKVSIGDDGSTQYLVNDGLFDTLEIAKTADGEFDSIRWTKAGSDLTLTPGLGSLYSHMEMNGYLNNGEIGYLQELKEKFDALAKGIADAVNYFHAQGIGRDGSTNLDFFVSSVAGGEITAATIALNPDIETNLDAIAAGLPGGSDPTNPEFVAHENSLALAIASLSIGWQEIPEADLNALGLKAKFGKSFADFYGGDIIATIGVDVQQANRMRAAQDVLLDHLSNQRDSISGVSLDEEMTNLIRFQKSYAAAARMVTVMDEMLDILVNRMGVTR